jgi:cytochrome c-type biogenesis protein CcsB
MQREVFKTFLLRIVLLKIMILDIPALESFFANCSFLILFFTTLYYWSKVIFLGESPYNQKGLLCYGCAIFCLTIQLLLRWIESGHFPLSNLYESLIFLAWCLLILHVYIENSMKTVFLGVLTSPAILCLIAFTDLSLPAELQRSSPLVPALQSNWLVMHVTVMIASYAALLLGCLLGIAYLIFSNFFGKSKTPLYQGFVLKNPLKFNDSLSTEMSSLSKDSRSADFEDNFLSFSQVSSLQKNLEKTENKNEIVPNFENLGQNGIFVSSPKIEDFWGKTEFSTRSQKRQFSPKFSKFEGEEAKFLVFLDNLSYRTIGIGFCFLTLGILSGAVWANETWGNYWSWDPKETWAFITWLTFACYLHSRLIGGWAGSKPAWIAALGFVIVWICYLGVNLLGQGLHSYGFLQI